MAQSIDVPAAQTQQVDDEHVVQVSLAQALCRVLGEAPDQPQSGEVINQLLDFSEAHFLSEQLLMRLSSYLELDEHVSDHERLAETIRSMADDWHAGRRKNLVERADALREALTRHIATRDRQFTAYHQRWLAGIADPAAPGVF